MKYMVYSKFPHKDVLRSKRNAVCDLIREQTVDANFQVQKSTEEESSGDEDIGSRSKTILDMSGKLHTCELS